jgi:N,N'-diacetylchitobiose phosphorylase
MPATRTPARHYWLSNAAGTYRSFVAPRGTGFSAYRDHLLTAWDADPVEDHQGFSIYIRDVESGVFWTAASASLPHQAPGSVVQTAGLATLRRTHQDVSSTVECAVLRDEAVELRRLTLHNNSERPRHLDVTSFVEVILNLPAAHAAHPAFSKLFVQTQVRDGHHDLIATRRPRSRDETHPCLAHALLGATVREWETDRARFLGRGRNWAEPQAMTGRAPLSATVGNVLDPAFSLRTAVSLQPGEMLSLGFLLIAADDRASLLRQLDASHRLDIDEMVTYARNPSGPSRTTQRCEPWLRLSAGFAAPSHNGATAPAPASTAASIAAIEASPNRPEEALQFFNGYGGFSADGREYVIRVGRDAEGHLRLPPMPWTNVLANERFGCVVSEKGASTTWSGNSREHRLTPWRNDPIADPHDDGFYVRDETTGAFWSPLPGPVAGEGDYEIRHGFGYSQWQHRSQDLTQDVFQFVARVEPLGIVRIRIGNTGTTPRRLSLYAYLRWVLGGSPLDEHSAVVVTVDENRRAVLARNPAADGFENSIAFAAVVGDGLEAFSWSGDRRAFLGVGGDAAAPAALRSGKDLNRATGRDPCAALRVEIEIAPGETKQIAFLRGEAASADELDRLLAAFSPPAAIDAALGEVRAFWTDLLGRVQIQTPSPAIDLMVNGWAAYQNLACRLWARSAFYQSGGAYGFRDQLQDAAAMIYLDPALTRRQILTNAAHQFVEGDVLHWWHPPQSRGIRTRFADDLLWLPYLTAFYIRSSGDSAVLDEPIRFLVAPLLQAGEDEVLLQPKDSGERADLFEHCCRAIDRSLVKGAHGLPLFGSGDWNDGMNRVGCEGRGESVWMGFFLVAVIGEFLPFCVQRGAAARVERYRKYRDELLLALNEAGWDGAWYRRAYYDDGTALGSRDSDECQIDALAQAWAVISGVAPTPRADSALDALEQRLISDSDGLIRLLAPPFVDTPHDPGYIKGYVAGVRENGGQYTHAALWVVKAMAEAGRRGRAAELLQMLSPVTHGSSAERIERYKIEPYVVAADVYGVAPHVGRGGWSWYTGSAGWYYRVALESVLGFTLQDGKAICLEPRIPDSWPGYRVSYRTGDGSCYEIEIVNTPGSAGRIVAARLDDVALAFSDNQVSIPLAGDGASHRVYVQLGTVA